MGVIIWVDKHEGTTRLRGYDRKLRNIVTMTETDGGENWRIQHYKETHVMKASGCPDPVDFIMRLISPRNEERYDDMAFLTFINHDTNESIEVWEMI